MTSFWAGHKGQVIAHVALLMVALLGFVALAVDFGHVYTKRRQMQNAADAGALAGAWEICFGDPSLAEVRAHEYATYRNGAQEAEVSIADYAVTVTATETTDTYLAGIIGLRTVSVPAVAIAACGKATSCCGLWPMAFQYSDDWESRACGEEFLLWEDGSADCETWNCDVDNDGVDELVLDGRAWVDFSGVLADGYPDPCDSPGCDIPELRDRIEGSNDEGTPCRSWMRIPSCSAGDSRVRDPAWSDAGDQAGEIKFIPLYDTTGCLMADHSGGCDSERYHIVEAGCIEVVEAYTLCKRTNPDYCQPRAILVRVSCDPQACASECGTTDGGPPGPGDIRAVSLIR